MITPIYPTSTAASASSQTGFQKDALTLDRLPQALFVNISTYLSTSAFVHFSSLSRAWRDWDSRAVWVTLTQRDFSSIHIQLALQHYSETVKTARLYASIYRRLLATTDLYPLHSVFSPTSVTSVGTVGVYRQQSKREWVRSNTLTGYGDWISAAYRNLIARYHVLESQDGTANVCELQPNREWVDTDIFLTGYPGGESNVFFDPKGRFIVATSGNTPGVYERQPNGKWVRIDTLTGHLLQVTSAAFDPKGRFIVTASDDCTAGVYKRQSNGKWVRIDTLTGHRSSIFNAAFDPKSRFIVTASLDDTSGVYKRQPNGKWIRIDTLTVKTDEISVHKAAFGPNGRFIITTSRDGTVRIWGQNTHKIIQRAIEQIALQDGGINGSYEDLPRALICYKVSSFLTPKEQQAHCLVNRVAALVYGHQPLLDRIAERRRILHTKTNDMTLPLILLVTLGILNRMVTDLGA